MNVFLSQRCVGVWRCLLSKASIMLCVANRQHSFVMTYTCGCKQSSRNLRTGSIANTRAKLQRTVDRGDCGRVLDPNTNKL